MVRVEFADGSEETFETRDCVYSPWGNSLSGDGIRLISVNAGGSIPYLSIPENCNLWKFVHLLSKVA